MYRISHAMLGPLLLLAVPMGAAQGALDIYLEQLPGRKILHTKYSKQGEAAVTHLEIAEASAKIDAANALIAQEIGEIERAAIENHDFTLRERGRIRRSTAFAGALVTEAANILAKSSGGSFNTLSNPLNRVWRDIQAASQHAVLSQATAFEAFGRICCGLDPENPTI
jgi:3-hydroxy-9,10-secoandrosta-1,3,5(10)-triene-9,17-dione monooxygenase